MTTYTEEKYQELSNTSIDVLSHITDIDKVKKLALLLRAELYKQAADIDVLEIEKKVYDGNRALACKAINILENERDRYKKGCSLAKDANIALIEVIRNMDTGNKFDTALDSLKAQVQEMFPETWTNLHKSK